MTNLSWDDLRYFLAAYRCQSIARAAKNMQVDYTTLSRRISALERQSRASLFVKTGGKLIATPFAQKLARAAIQMENSLSSHFPVSHPESASARSKLRLATFDMVASSWIAPKLPNLRLKCPDLEIELVSAFEYVDLEKLDADLSVSCSRPARSRLMHMKLGYLNFSVYGSREYLRARPLLSSDDLTGHDLLLYYKDLAPLQEAGWFQRASRECKVALTSNCSLSLLHAAEEGLGLAVLPVCMAARSSHLIRINPRTVSRHELWLAYHPDLKKDRSVREMVEFLKSLACDETAPI